MAIEKIIYRFRYEQPFHIRKRLPYLERPVQLVKETRYGSDLKCYQVIGKFTVAERLKLEEQLGSQFPLRQRLNGNRLDALSVSINEFADQVSEQLN